MRSNPVKLASWSTRKVPLPTNARTSVPAPPVRLSPAFSVAAVAYTVEPEEGADNRVVASGETHNAWRGWWRRIRSGLIDNFLHRGGCEDGVALIGAEGEAAGDDGVLPRTAGNLKRRAQVADREGRAQGVGAGDREPSHRRVGKVERRSCGRQLVVLSNSQ